MSALTIQKAHEGHVDDLVWDVRPMDAKEWVAAGGMRVRAVLTECVRQPYTRTILDEEGKVLCLYGAYPLAATDPYSTGSLWLIATNRAVPRFRAIHAHYREALEELRRAFPWGLEAWVWEKNELHRHWLRRMGFREQAVRSNPAGFMFIQCKEK